MAQVLIESFVFRAFIVLSIVLAACEPRTVTVKAALPGFDGVEAPVANLPIVILPYDRDSILRTLEAAAPDRRPHTQELDSLFALWREPFGRYARTSWLVKAITDSLARLRARLDSLPRNAPAYQELYRHFADLTDSLRLARERSEPARQELDRLRRRLIPKVDSLRRDVTVWENSTFRRYESLVGNLTQTQDPLADTTGADGKVSLHLKDGRWYVYAWTWDPGDPYSEWYWNVPVTGDSVVLDARSGKRRPRY